MPTNKWTREELIIAFNLYCKIPFGKIHIHNPDIISLAKILGRTPSAVSWKLANFASLDPFLKKRNISGASHGSKLMPRFGMGLMVIGISLLLKAKNLSHIK